MRNLLRLLAAILLIVTVAWWLTAGANRGWTRTSVPKAVPDEVTGLVGTTYEKKFVPGLDFLASACAGTVILGGVSFLFPRKPRTDVSKVECR